MRNLTRIIVAALVVLAAALVVPALADGVDAGSFARNGVGARGFGMGGALAAIADGPETAFWNPVLLPLLPELVVGGMYSDKFGLDIVFQSLGVASAVAERVGFSALLIRSSIDGIPFTGDEGDGVFSETQSLYMGSVGIDLTNYLFDTTVQTQSKIGVGGSIKAFSHELLEGHGFGIGFDLGISASLALDWGHVEFGLTSSDVAETAIQWTGTDHNPENYVPWVNHVSAAVRLFERSLVIAAQADFAVSRTHLDRFRLGVEYSPIAGLAGRAGVVLGKNLEPQYSAGGTIMWKGLELHYGYQPNNVLGDTHYFSFNARFNDIYSRIERTAIDE